MKLRNLIKKNNRRSALNELKQDFKPIVQSIKDPVTNYAKKNPKTTLFLMFTIVVINILLLFFFTNSYKSKATTNVNSYQFDAFVSPPVSAPDIKPSLDNILKVKALKDTLNYLMSLKEMSYQDTLTFIRVTEDFHAITNGKGGLPPITLQELRALKAQKDSLITITK